MRQQAVIGGELAEAAAGARADVTDAFGTGQTPEPGGGGQRQGVGNAIEEPGGELVTGAGHVDEVVDREGRGADHLVAAEGEGEGGGVVPRLDEGGEGMGDSIAAAVENAATDSGLKIPEEVEVVSLVGTKYANIVRPSLTSMQIDMAEVGKRAMYMLIDLLNHDLIEKTAKFDAHIVIRNSTKV